MMAQAYPREGQERGMTGVRDEDGRRRGLQERKKRRQTLRSARPEAPVKRGGHRAAIWLISVCVCVFLSQNGHRAAIWLINAMPLSAGISG